MNARHSGLTPKMKPISPRRSALVAALDVGSSKVVCLIARLRPHPPQQVLTRRSHAVEVVGFGHTGARGMKAGGVVNLAQAEEAIRQAVDSAERMASVEIESVVLSMFGGLVGTVLGAIVAMVISSLTPIPASIEPWSVALGIGITAVVGLFFGLYPAMRAAGLDPIEALRRE